MSFKLFTISTMYPGYLGSFYSKFKGTNNLSYDDHYNLLLEDTTEFVGSYTSTFRKLGIDSVCIIANDSKLQRKWRSENCNKNDNNSKILAEQVKKFQPQILWIENLSYTDIEWLKDIRKSVKSIKLIIAYHCSPISLIIEDRLKYVDFILTCTPGLKSDMEAKGFKAYLVYHGFDKDLLDRISTAQSSPKCNFIFSGSLSPGAGFHEKRIELIEALLKEDIDIDLFANLEKKHKIRIKQILFSVNKFMKIHNLDTLSRHLSILQYAETPITNYSGNLLRKKRQPVFGIEMYRLFSNSKVVLNFHIGVAGNFAGNMRLFEVTGVGSCLLTDNKSNLGDLFDTEKEIVVYNDIDDCISKAKWLLENEEERKKIAYAGQQKTLTYHTVENRCRQILDIIEGELSNLRN